MKPEGILRDTRTVPLNAVPQSKISKRSKTHLGLDLGCSMDILMMVGTDSGPANASFGS